MDVSNITEKGQITIPARMRKTLKLKKGDRVAFELKGESVVLRKATPMDIAYLSGLEAQLSEWGAKEDARAYDSL